jgi:hypothetical protein
LLNTEEHPEITVSSKRTRKAVFFMVVSPFLESCLGGTSKGSTKSLVELGRKLYAICDFNLIEKRVGGNTAIPFDVNKLTPQVIDNTQDGPLAETSDQPFVGSDFFRDTASHAVLAQIDHLRTPPSDRSTSMPRDLFVHDNLSTVFVRFDDRITPT